MIVSGPSQKRHYAARPRRNEGARTTSAPEGGLQGSCARPPANVQNIKEFPIRSELVKHAGR